MRYVINEHYPYYAYEDFRKVYGSYSKLSCKIGRLLFRLSNYWQPVAFYGNTEMYDGFINAGCMNTTCLPFPMSVQNSDALGNYRALNGHHIIYIDICSFKGDMVKLLSECTPNTMLVVAGLFPKHKKLWDDIKLSEFTGITYNLYYCGIVFFDKTKYKQHYEVNF